jgi:phage baseplate assembly protein V
MSEQVFRGAIERIFRRAMLAIGRGRVTVVDDSGPVQKLQTKLGPLEVRDNTPRLIEYGFTSNPPVGTDLVAIFVGGDRSNGVVIATGNQQYRMKGLADGEVAIYDKLGQSVYLTKNGIVINGAGLPMIIENTPTVTVKASMKVRLETPLLEVTGDIIDNVGGNANNVAAMRSIYNSHTHPDPQGGSTGTPSATQ